MMCICGLERCRTLTLKSPIKVSICCWPSSDTGTQQTRFFGYQGVLNGGQNLSKEKGGSDSEVVITLIVCLAGAR